MRGKRPRARFWHFVLRLDGFSDLLTIILVHRVGDGTYSGGFAERIKGSIPSWVHVCIAWWRWVCWWSENIDSIEDLENICKILCKMQLIVPRCEMEMMIRQVSVLLVPSACKWRSETSKGMRMRHVIVGKSMRTYVFCVENKNGG